MKILITGGTGQVGFELRRTLAPRGEILSPTRQQLDLFDSQAVSEYLQRERPELIVNAAAYTAVDKAESDAPGAYRLNAELASQLAAFSAANNQWLIHYSSDYVYPGEGSSAFREDAGTGPLGVYGASKLAGDEAIAESGCHHLIFRTSWVYGARGQNFMKTMLRLARERSELGVVADQVGAPTPARLIAEITGVAVGNLHSCPTSGIYHLAPRGETSWHGFATEIFTQAVASGVQLRLDPASVKAIATEDYPTPAKRPKNSRLNLDKTERTFGVTLPDWRSQLALTLEEYLTINA